MTRVLFTRFCKCQMLKAIIRKLTILVTDNYNHLLLFFSWCRKGTHMYVTYTLWLFIKHSLHVANEEKVKTHMCLINIHGLVITNMLLTQCLVERLAMSRFMSRPILFISMNMNKISLN